MRIYANIDTQRLVTAPLTQEWVTSISLPRASSVPIWIQFIRDNAVADLDPNDIEVADEAARFALTSPDDVALGDIVLQSDTGVRYEVIDTAELDNADGYEAQSALVIRWTVKADGEFDGDQLVALSAFTKSGSGTSTIYKGSANYITTALNTLLGVNPPTTINDVEEVTLMAEVSWSGPEDGKCHWVEHIVRNDLYKAGDPVPASPALPWISPGTYHGITGLAGGGSTNLDGLDTIATTSAFIFVDDVTYGFGLWELMAGTTAEDVAGGILRPDDYAATTNEKIWIRRI